VAAVVSTTTATGSQPGKSKKKRFGGSGGVVQQEGALAEVVQHQPPHDQCKPIDADRAAAEMPHIGV
jgi:hypothetical protein